MINKFIEYKRYYNNDPDILMYRFFMNEKYMYHGSFIHYYNNGKVFQHRMFNNGISCGIVKTFLSSYEEDNFCIYKNNILNGINITMKYQ